MCRILRPIIFVAGMITAGCFHQISTILYKSISWQCETFTVGRVRDDGHFGIIGFEKICWHLGTQLTHSFEKLTLCVPRCRYILSNAIGSKGSPVRPLQILTVSGCQEILHVNVVETWETPCYEETCSQIIFTKR